MYRKAPAMGGKLIRRIIQLLRAHNVQLPLKSRVLIAVSGGSDSVGLAHLLVHFGRKVILDQEQIHLLHVNHHWRGETSTRDQKWVEELGKKWGVNVITHQLDPNLPRTELAARTERKRIFQTESKRLGVVILTGHQADDLAETILWRLCTGSAQTHGGGIRVQSDSEIRPFLTTRKQEILDYLKEVDQVYQVDETNQSLRYLRAKMRIQLMPVIEKIFPRAIDHLSQLALAVQRKGRLLDEKSHPGPALLRALGINARRPHLDFMLQQDLPKNRSGNVIQLPGGWQLMHLKLPTEKWILEKREGTGMSGAD